MSTDFPEKLPAKLKAIPRALRNDSLSLRLLLELTKTNLQVSLWGYAKMANVPVENLLHDDRDLWFGHRVNTP